MSPLSIIPWVGRLEEKAREASSARVRAESELRDLRAKVADLQGEVIAAQEKALKAQEQRLDDRGRMLDWMCVAQRWAPIFSRVEDLPAPPEPPSTEAVRVSRMRAEDLEIHHERAFLEAMAKANG